MCLNVCWVFLFIAALNWPVIHYIFSQHPCCLETYVAVSVLLFLICVCVDAQDGVLVLLPAESQQRLVQLLYFLPKMSQSLLVQLSCCCTAGRITAGLATSLIRIVHLRWGQRPWTLTEATQTYRYSVTYFTVLDSDHKVAVLHLYTWIYTPGLIYNNIIYNNKWFSSFSLTHSLHFCLLSVCVHMWASVFGFKGTGACVSWFHTKGPLGSRNATSSELLCSCAFQAS